MREPLDRRCELLDLLPVVELVERFRNEGLQPVQLLGVERLFDVVVSALPHGLHGRIDGRLSGDDDALGRDAARLHLLEQREPIKLGHHQVGERDTERVAREAVHRFLPVESDLDLVPLVRQNRAQSLRYGAIVIGNQDLRLLHEGMFGLARRSTAGRRSSIDRSRGVMRMPCSSAAATRSESGGGGTRVAPVMRRKIPSSTTISHAAPSSERTAASTLRATAARAMSGGAAVAAFPSDRSMTRSPDPARTASSRANRVTTAAMSTRPGSGRTNANSASVAAAAVSKFVAAVAANGAIADASAPRADRLRTTSRLTATAFRAFLRSWATTFASD